MRFFKPTTILKPDLIQSVPLVERIEISRRQYWEGGGSFLFRVINEVFLVQSIIQCAKCVLTLESRRRRVGRVSSNKSIRQIPDCRSEIFLETIPELWASLKRVGKLRLKSSGLVCVCVCVCVRVNIKNMSGALGTQLICTQAGLVCE